MHRKTPKLFTLLHEMATSPDFTDFLDLKKSILKHYTALESSLNQNALKYAVNFSASGLTTATKIADAWYGLDLFLDDPPPGPGLR